MSDKKRYLKSQDIERIIARCMEIHQTHTNQNYEKLAVLFYFLYRTGRRVSEIIGLKPFNERTTGLRPCDIDFNDNTYKVSVTKKNVVYTKNRYGKPINPEKKDRDKFFKKPYYESFAMHPDLPELLKSYIERYNIHQLDRLFPFSRDYPTHVFQRICRELKITLGTFTRYNKDGTSYQVTLDPAIHTLRHSFAINFIKQNNRNVSLLKQILCHSHLEITQSYLKFGKEDEHEALQNLKF